MNTIEELQEMNTIEELQEIVKDFNTRFDSWTKDNGCRVTFGWQYNAGPEKQIKAMEILGIDMIIYRKPPPKSLSELMEKGRDTQ